MIGVWLRKRKVSLFSLKRMSTVALIQMNASNDKERNYETCSRLISQIISSSSSNSSSSSSSPVQLICLPECFSFIGENASESIDAAEYIHNSSILERYKDLAKKNNVWLSLGGFQELTIANNGQRKVSNLHAIVNPMGEILPQNCYRKIHLFDSPYSNLFESNSTVAGNEIVCVDMGFATVGLTICFDLRFPALFQALRYGSDSHPCADIILVPSAFTVPTGQAHWEILLRARAIETQCMVIAAAQAGQHNQKRTSFGHSMIIDSWGSIVASCGEELEGYCLATFTKEEQDKVRMGLPVKVLTGLLIVTLFKLPQDHYHYS